MIRSSSSSDYIEVVPLSNGVPLPDVEVSGQVSVDWTGKSYSLRSARPRHTPSRPCARAGARPVTRRARRRERRRSSSRTAAPARGDPSRPSGDDDPSRPPPTLAEVLAAVRPGRTRRIALTNAQKSAFRDRDGTIALDVVRHLLGARHTLSSPTRFPLTERTFQAVARRLGHTVGIKRCRAMLRRLRAAKVLAPAGSYRTRYTSTAAPSGWCVRLVRLAVPFAPLRVQRAVGTNGSVKGDPHPRWWEHALFGTPDGRPPPGFSPERLARMKSHDERHPRSREAAA